MTENEIEITAEDQYSKLGAQLTRLRYHPSRNYPRMWPKLDRDMRWVVGKADGVPVGCGFLATNSYPFAELGNLEVSLPFRGRGVGGGIVARIAKEAAEMGFYALCLQVHLDNTVAHRFYARYGFLPATQGRMLRLVRILNHPALFRFLHEHPLAQFASRPGEGAGLPRWEMAWTDRIDGARFALVLRGGSSDKDSDGFGPALCAFEMAAGSLDVRVELTGPAEVVKGDAFDVEVCASNRGEGELAGNCGLVLNSGLKPESRQGVDLSVEPGSSQALTLPVRADEAFDVEALKRWVYPSLPTVVEVFIGDYIFWLNCQHKVRER